MTTISPQAATQSVSATEIISSLDRFIACHDEPVRTKIGLDYGLLGLVCYLRVKGMEENASSPSEAEQSIMETIFSKLNDGYLYHDMYREITDLAHFLSVNAERYGYRTREQKNELLGGLDGLILNQVAESRKNREFDPVTGAIKYGLYLLGQIDRCPKYVTEITAIIDLLDDLSVSLKVAGGIGWPATFNESGDYYTGLSHGIAGVLLFCTYAQAKVNHPKLEGLIEGCIAALTAVIDTNQPTIFPVVIGKTYRTGEFPKSYAYGDYATLFAFLFSLKLLNRTDELRSYLHLFNVIHQKGYGAEYFDAGSSILYGDAGLILLFQRFREEFELPEATLAYHQLTKKLSERYDPDGEYLGFKGHWSQHLPWTNLSFTEGVIGIRCVLAATENAHLFPLFDRYLFLRQPFA